MDEQCAKSLCGMRFSTWGRVETGKGFQMPDVARTHKAIGEAQENASGKKGLVSATEVVGRVFV